ncbi:hypothetical protein [Pseudomaricurvus sp.]|uniref:hypothetical protein n=1 Tax=Pseudomaricurvus sp. TaxID=2004510 RepID=UPI003F6B8919
MTVDRKEPTLSGLGSTREEPAVSPSSSPSSNSTKSTPKSSAQEALGRGDSHHGSSRRPAPVSSSRGQAKSPLVPFALILALTGLGLAGFSYWQLVKVQHQASGAEKRIEELEQRLALSDDESTQSVTTLQANLRETRKQLDTAESEIRKLWDTRNVNKKGIADNKAQLASVEKSAKSASSAAASANKLAKSQESNWKALSDNISLQGEQLNVLSDATDSQKKQMRELIDKANKVDSQMQQLKTDLARRVKRNEDAIEAIDAYRRTVNRDILDLKRQLNPGL